MRHGETEWSKIKRHTGRTDIPLTPHGEAEAATLPGRLAAWTFARVLCSPLQRARQTCAIAGFGDRAEFCDDIMEWNYGELEGHTLAEWHASHPGWDIWKDGCPGGETIDDVGTRADRVIAHLSVNPVTTVLFAHGHLLRALTARWLHLPAACARNLVLGTTAISVLTWEHDLRVLDRWNLSEAEASVPAGPHPPATER